MVKVYRNGEETAFNNAILSPKEVLLFKLSGKCKCPVCGETATLRNQLIIEETVFHSLDSACKCSTMTNIINWKGKWEIYWDTKDGKQIQRPSS